MKVLLRREIAVTGLAVNPDLREFKPATKEDNAILAYLIKRTQEHMEVPDGIDYDGLCNLVMAHNIAAKHDHEMLVAKIFPMDIRGNADLYLYETE